MSRPVRIEFPTALYHATARSNQREDIFEDDTDRQAFLRILAEVVEQFNWLCYAWYLMDNHDHLLIQTPDANLSKGMRQLTLAGVSRNCSRADCGSPAHARADSTVKWRQHRAAGRAIHKTEEQSWQIRQRTPGNL
ncbi:MAG: transposase [Burkholderiales bacterium]